MTTSKQYIYIFFFSFIFIQQGICNFCNVTFNYYVESPICRDEPTGKIEIQVMDGEPPFVYSFDGGNTFSTESILENSLPGNYEIVVEDANGCNHSENIVIPNVPNFQISLPPNMNVNLGETIDIIALVNAPYNSIKWSSSSPEDLLCINCFQQQMTPLSTQTLTLSVIFETGCEVMETIQIEVNKEDDIFIPNAFTPNDDGHNDRFTVFAGQSISQIKSFYVFNTWGGVVFELLNFQGNIYYNGWDGKFHGKDMNPGVFLYQVEVEYIDGTTKQFVGDVLLHH